MYFQYGSYRHSDNEVDVTSMRFTRMYSKRNTLAFVRKSLVLQGHLIADGQAANKAAIEAMEQAYKLRSGGENGAFQGSDLNAGLYHDDGTLSAHFLDASEAVNGVRLQLFSWDKKDGGEYATGRAYSIVLVADYINPEDQIFAFEETVQFIGNCGPQWELVTQFTGPPRVEWIADQTPQRIIQSGTAVGIQAWPYMPGELLPENYKHGNESFWERQSPELSGRNGNTLFPIRWRYVFSSVDKLDFFPHPDFPGH